MVSIYALQLDSEINESCFRYLVNKANEKTRQKVLGFRQKQDAYRSLFAHYLAKYAIMRYTDPANNNFEIYHAANGKPYVSAFENVHFNLAHSGQWLVCAINDSPVGIDIEQKQPDGLNELAAFFSEAEQAAIPLAPTQTQEDLVYELWTLKESFLKFTGEGLRRPLNSFSVSIAGATIKIENTDGAKIPVFFKQYEIDPGYKMAACADKDGFAEIIHISLAQFLVYF